MAGIKISNIHLTGFKSFISKDIPLGNLTLLTGINSSGKSSIIQALRMLHHALGGYADPFLQGHGNAEELKNRNSKWPIVLSALFDNGTEARISITDCQTDCNVRSFPDVTYISASRFGPQSIIPVYNNDEIGQHGENMLQAIELHHDDVVPAEVRHPSSEGDTVFFNLRGWLSTIAPGTRFDQHIVKPTDASYMTFNNFRAANVGFGLSYTMPVIAALLLATVKDESQIVLIENPEAHLHPKGQTELAELVCRAANVGVQVVIETHSDHFFDGVRIFCKKHPEFCTEVKIHWCEIMADGNTNIESPNIRPDGKLTKWPKGLFDQFEINADALL